LIALVLNVVHAGQPIRNLSVSLRGKQYDVSDVSTVKELQTKIQAVSGIDADQQGNVMFGGKLLESDAILKDAGVDDGSSISILPAGFPSKEELEERLEQAGVSKDKLEEMMKSLGGGDGAGMPSLEDSVKAMTDVMNSPMFQEMMSDPAKLEQSRQMILNNAMLKGMMGSMPGMEDLLNDEVAWRQAMQAAAELYKNMDANDLVQAMMGGGAAGGGAGANFMDMDLLGNGTPMDTSSTAAKALEELDEDD
jgi:Ubiquitin family